MDLASGDDGSYLTARCCFWGFHCYVNGSILAWTIVIIERICIIIHLFSCVQDGLPVFKEGRRGCLCLQLTFIERVERKK